MFECLLQHLGSSPTNDDHSVPEVHAVRHAGPTDGARHCKQEHGAGRHELLRVHACMQVLCRPSQQLPVNMRRAQLWCYTAVGLGSRKCCAAASIAHVMHMHMHTQHAWAV